ncbi:hypothetical protein [Halobacteriovorax sp. HLS]|uniref:hypothetical protein n=1 Tax=Halobacteriovorax sp. HLS TaxID=2234000 RepID=UPI000FD8A8FC|nr:hypothetical protein [Halobacteriovorax sp. HLS]
MFYLNLFIQNVRRHPFWGSAFFITTSIMVLCAMNFSSIENYIFKSSLSLDSGPSFHALISGDQNHQRISRKVLELPGVQKVSFSSKEEIQSQVKSVLSGVDLQMKFDDLDLNYVGLKISLEQGLQPRSQNLIRDYLVRLVGASNVTLGATKSISRSQLLKNQIFSTFREWGVLVVSISFVIIWALVAVGFSVQVKKSSYLIEKFQRRSKVGLKVMLLATMTIFITSFALTISIGQLSLIGMVLGLVLLLASTAFQMRSLQWQD